MNERSICVKHYRMSRTVVSSLIMVLVRRCTSRRKQDGGRLQPATVKEMVTKRQSVRNTVHASSIWYVLNSFLETTLRSQSSLTDRGHTISFLHTNLHWWLCEWRAKGDYRRIRLPLCCLVGLMHSPLLGLSEDLIIYTLSFLEPPDLVLLCAVCILYRFA